MEKRNVEITLDTARKWYYGDNESLKEIALQAFTEEELTEEHWKRITTFEGAYLYLKKNKIREDLIRSCDSLPIDIRNTYINTVLKYQIVVAALTNNEERHLTTGDRWYPIVQFCRPQDRKNCWGNVYIGTIKSEGKIYDVVGGSASDSGGAGLGFFCLARGVSLSYSYLGFRSISASREIAEHISKYFGKLLFEVHYGGTNCDWKWIK